MPMHEDVRPRITSQTDPSTLTDKILVEEAVGFIYITVTEGFNILFPPALREELNRRGLNAMVTRSVRTTFGRYSREYEEARGLFPLH